MMKRLGILIVVLLASCAVWAGDGIAMGNAVFYPSVEVEYSHTDNLYLQNSSMPYGNISDYFWLVRPAVGFEFPFKQSYLRFDFAYQYKEYGTYQLSDPNSYDAHLKGDFSLGQGVKLIISEDFLQGVQEVLKFDPGYETYFSNTPFHANVTRLGLQFALGHLDSLEAYGLYNTVRMDANPNPDNPPPFYSYTQTGGGLTWRHHYNPEANWLVDVQYIHNTPELVPADIYIAMNPYKTYNDWRVMAGWEGAASRRFAGYAKLGYENMHFPDNSWGNFTGLVVNAGLGFTPSEFLKLTLDLFRNPFQSAYNVNNYYTATGGQFKINQELTRHFYWSAGYLYQENSYPDAVVADVYGTGQASTTEFALTAGQTRNDKISQAFGEFGFHVSKQISFRANYEYNDRKSNIQYYSQGMERQPYTYTENRFMVQAQFGW